MTPRALLLGLAGVVALSLFTPYSDLVLRGTWLGLTSFPIGAFVILLGLVLANAPLRRLRRGLSANELRGAYAMMLAGAGVASFGLTGLLLSYAAGPHYFATPENFYAVGVIEKLPRWLLFDEALSKGLYEGLPPNAALPAGVVLRMGVGWGILVAGLYACLLSIVAAVRRSWIEQERLVFPLMQLPLAVTDVADGRALPAFLRNPLVWTFFAVPFVLHSINGIHHHIPAVPQVNIHLIDLGAHWGGRYAEAVKPFWLRLSFSVIGLSYLLPSEVGFSLWFFYLVFLVQQLVGAKLGYTMSFVQAYPVRRFVALQMIGGVIVQGLLLLWTARKHLAGRWRRDEEALSRRGVVGLAAGGLLLLGLWGQLVGAGVGWVVGLCLVYLLFQLVATRLVAEAGMLYVQHPYRPLNLALSAFGTGAMGARRIPALTLLDHLFMLDNRSPLQPAALEGLKLAEAGGARPRGFFWAMILAVAIAVPASLYSATRLMTSYGGSTLNPWFTGHYANNLWCPWTTHLVTVGEPARPADLLWVATGAASMTGLLTAHFVSWRWPLHPLGYLMGASWPMINFWFPILLGWLLKSATLRFGGAKLYRKLLPGFLALILAEYVSAGLWVMIDAIAGVRGHEIFTF